MTEENENNEPNQSHSEATGQNAADKLAEIEALEGKIKTLRWGLFIGVLAILTIGLNAIYNTSKKAIQPVVEVYDEAKETYEGVETKINDAQTEFVRLQPKVEKAYGILNELIDSDSKPTAKLRTELKTRLENEVEPAAERLADRIFVDIRGDAMKQLADLSENSDDIMRAAHEEYRSITNSLPDRVTEAIEETQPADPGQLVGPQCANESLGLIDHRHRSRVITRVVKELPDPARRIDAPDGQPRFVVGLPRGQANRLGKGHRGGFLAGEEGQRRSNLLGIDLHPAVVQPDDRGVLLRQQFKFLDRQ